MADGSGNFDLPNVPPGDYTLVVKSNHTLGSLRGSVTPRDGLGRINTTFRRHAALIKLAVEDVSSEDLQQVEVILKKIGKRAESLAAKKGHSHPG